jgi:SP family general alpha glucoside:H+ symporter-like MFS transporter
MPRAGVNTITVALPGFKLVFGYVYEGELLVAASWNALWTAMSSVGMLFGMLLVLFLEKPLVLTHLGGIACGYVSDRLGRRAGMIIGSILSIIGVAVQYISESPSVLLVGKIASNPIL